MMPAPLSRHRQPAFEIRVDGEDISQLVSDRLVSLTLTDHRGFEADQLDLVLADHDGRLALPPKGALITLRLGWVGEPLADKGSYTVDEVEHSGAPDQLTLRARSADLRGGALSSQRERSWHATTLGAVVATIAGENDLAPVVGSGLAAQVIAHEDQTNESDIAFLTRLARLFDAIATVKSGRLLFLPTAGAVSASGKPLPALHITRQEGDQHRFSTADRDTYAAVKAGYYDTATGQKGEVVWGDAEDQAERGRRPAPPDAPTPAAGPTAYQRLPQTRKSRERARRLARKEWARLSALAAWRAQWAGVEVAYDNPALGAAGVVRHGAAEEAKAKASARRQAEKDAERQADAAPAVAVDRGGDRIKSLRHVYANRENAKRAARAEWRRLQRGVASFSLTLAIGDASIAPDLPATVTGFKAQIDGTDWIVTKATHQVTEAGFTTAVELEVRATELPG